MPNPTPVATSRPTINERFRVRKTLGKGGMGEVFLVEDLQRGGQLMALKTLLPSTTDRLLRAGFRDEFASLAKVRHEHLAAAYDFGRVVGTNECFFTTEFIDGVDLMQGTRDATVPELLETTAQLLRGLDFLHDLRLVHNDLKPGNILLQSPGSEEGLTDAERGLSKLESLACSARGRVKIIDFGLIAREGVACEKVLGTLRFISPERIRRQAADRRSDLYSTGIILYLLFSRKLPFTERDPKVLLRRHLEDEPVPLESLRPDLPPVIPRLVHKLLRKSPEDRFSSAGEALAFLRSGSESSEARSGSPPASSAARTPTGTSRRLTPGALLHRSAELEALRDSFEDALAGFGSVRSWTIEGGAGVGKTRLVEELRGLVQVRDGAFIHVDGGLVEGNLQPVCERVLAGFRTCGAEGLEELSNRLRCGGAEDSSPINSVLESLLFRQSGSRPVLLHIDDFDRASTTVRRWTLELLHSLEYRAPTGSDRPRLLVLISRRSSTRSAELGTTKTLRLANFDAPQSHDFLRKLFEQDDVPQAVLEHLTAIAQGNPLFLTELANALVETRQVVLSRSRWVFPETIERLTLPDSLGAVFEEKIDSLSSAELEVMHWVAVSGRPLHALVLERCMSRSANLDAAIDSLKRQNLVTALEESDHVEIALTHVGSREALNGRLEANRLRILHQRLAQNLEDALPNWADRADELAAHWLAAGNDAGFLRFAPKASQLLRERGDFDTAVEYHRRLIDAMPDTAVAKKIQSLSKLAEMHETRWDLIAAITCLLEIQKLGAKLLKPADQALLLRRLGCIQIGRHNHAAAENFLAKASHLLGEDGAPLVRFAIDAPRAWALWFSGDRARAEGLLAACLTTSEHARPESDREQMLLIGGRNHAASLLHQVGRLDEAIQLWRENLAIIATLDQPQALCATHCSLGGALLDRGHFEEALVHLEPAERIGKEICDFRTLAKSRERLGDLHLRNGRFVDALHVTRAGLQDAEELSNSTAIANSLRTLGRVYLFADEIEEARRAFERSVALQLEAKDVLSSVLSRLELANLELEAEEIEPAIARLRQCERDANRHGLPLLQAHAKLGLFRARWKAERVYDRRLAESGIRFLEIAGYDADAAEALLLQAEIALRAGERAEHAAILSVARDRIAAHGLPDASLRLEHFRALELAAQGELIEACEVARHVASRAREEHRLRDAAAARQLIATLRSKSSSGKRPAPVRPALPRRALHEATEDVSRSPRTGSGAHQATEAYSPDAEPRPDRSSAQGATEAYSPDAEPRPDRSSAQDATEAYSPGAEARSDRSSAQDATEAYSPTTESRSDQPSAQDATEAYSPTADPGPSGSSRVEPADAHADALETSGRTDVPSRTR